MSAPGTTSWIESANDDSGFGLQHLPFGVFAHQNTQRICIAIGAKAIDLYSLADTFPDPIAAALRAPTLNPFLALGARAWENVRARLQTMLAADVDTSTQQRVAASLLPRNALALVYPLATRGFVDFYASIDHARRVGELFRPENPLLPNYTHIPIAYNGRASSLVVSGTPIRRPWGQRKPATAAAPPDFLPTAALDYEAELAFIAGYGNALGEAQTIAEARASLFGVALLNDWSARDIQSWEYQPLGPFLGKSFATSLSPWITPMSALAPYRVSVRTHDQPPLPYLLDTQDQQTGALDIRVETWLRIPNHPGPVLLAASNTRDLFWSPAQMLTHAASNGCPIEPGDLFASGTISGPDPASAGCLLELTHSGRDPLSLANGEHRAWLEDGDEVILRAFAERDGLPRLALGECTGQVLPAHRNHLPR